MADYIWSQNQDQIKNIKYGWFNSSYNGCGWIAAYNVLTRCGLHKQPEQVAKELSKTLLFGGVFGTLLCAVKTYLITHGLEVTECRCVEQFDDLVRKADCAVLYYSRSNLSRHFVYGEYLPLSGKVRYMNSSSVACDVSEFVKNVNAINPVILAVKAVRI